MRPLGSVRLVDRDRLQRLASGEELREARQHVIVDVTVYGCEFCFGQPEVGAGILDWFAEYQFGRKQFVVRYVLVGQRNDDFNFLGVIKRAPTQPIGQHFELNDGVAAAHRDVLVKVVKLVQLPEGIGFHVFPSVVRLEGLDNLDGLTRNIPGRPHEPLPVLRRVVGVERECAGSTGCSAAQQSQLPRKMIQGRAQAMDVLPDTDRQHKVEFFERDTRDFYAELVVVLFRDGIWVFPVSIGVALQLVEVMPRPSRLRLRIQQPSDVNRQSQTQREKN